MVYWLIVFICLGLTFRCIFRGSKHTFYQKPSRNQIHQFKRLGKDTNCKKISYNILLSLFRHLEGRAERNICLKTKNKLMNTIGNDEKTKRPICFFINTT